MCSESTSVTGRRKESVRARKESKVGGGEFSLVRIGRPGYICPPKGHR